MNDEKVIEAANDTFTGYLRQRKLRRTPERFAVLEAAISIQGHFTIDTVVDMLSAGAAVKRMAVSRATVYNTMGLLVDCGLLRCHRFAGNATQYETVGRGRSNHLHLVCTECGKVRELADVEIERIINTRRFGSFVPEYFSVSIYGECSRCHRRRKKERKSSSGSK